MAKSLDVVPLRKVIVTTLRRTLETAQPSIDELATRSTSPPQLVRLSPGSYARVVDEVWEQQDGASLVVGHMQTIPALVRRIAARVPATSRSSLALPDFVRYGDLFVLDGDDAGSLSLTALRFGDDAPW